MARKFNRHPEDARLWKVIDEMDAQMEAEGVEDATAWPPFGEYESVLYTIFERMVEREGRWEAAFEVEELVEFAEIAEESALSEVAVYGYAAPWFFGEPDLNELDLWYDERRLDDEGWNAWNDAADDIPERFFELDMSM